MAEYTVTWTIQVDAVSALQAAKIAKWYQRNGEWSSTFEIDSHETDRKVVIDLDDVLTEDDWADIYSSSYLERLANEVEEQS